MIQDHSRLDATVMTYFRRQWGFGSSCHYEHEYGLH